ncbi:hypothetical protein ABZ319_24485 [Nocardia sp. NPDC005978]|uniref:hypothetical protein n=1 Tax=Nocardia sp. NPDC005978 TaxID=3156725 RepID=UPI0033BB9B33
MSITTELPATDSDFRWRAYALIGGGVLFAIGNALHPLRHSEESEQAATWVAAHVSFSAGAVLMAASLPLVTAAWHSLGRPGIARLAAVTRALLYAGLAVAIPIGGYHEAFVAPRLSHHEQHAIETAAMPVNGPLAACFLVGFLLLAGCAFAAPNTLLARPAAAVLVVSVLVMGAAEGLPGAEGLWIIPGTIAVGLVVAFAGVRALRGTRASTPRVAVSS